MVLVSVNKADKENVLIIFGSILALKILTGTKTRAIFKEYG